MTFIVKITNKSIQLCYQDNKINKQISYKTRALIIFLNIVIDQIFKNKIYFLFKNSEWEVACDSFDVIGNRISVGGNQESGSESNNESSVDQPSSRGRFPF